MIKVKGRVVTFTGKDQKALKAAAVWSGKTPRQYLHEAIKFYVKLHKEGKTK